MMTFIDCDILLVFLCSLRLTRIVFQLCGFGNCSHCHFLLCTGRVKRLHPVDKSDLVSALLNVAFRVLLFCTHFLPNIFSCSCCQWWKLKDELPDQ